MPSLFVAPTVNYKQTTLNGAISSSATTITLNSTTNLQAPGYLVIDRQDANGNNTPSAREVVSYTGVSGSTVTGATRGADGSTALSHNDGALVETMPTVGMWNSLATIVGSGLDSNGMLLPIASAVSIAYPQMIQTAITSIASIALISTVTLNPTTISAGVKGHFLWTSSGALTTSLATSSNNSQIAFLRATKNLSLASIYVGLNSAPSLGPLKIDIHNKSTPTGVTGPSIFSVLPLVGVGLNDNLAGATPGTLTLTSLASGQLLYPEILQPNQAGDLTLQITAIERI